MNSKLIYLFVSVAIITAITASFYSMSYQNDLTRQSSLIPLGGSCSAVNHFCASGLSCDIEAGVCKKVVDYGSPCPENVCFDGNQCTDDTCDFLDSFGRSVCQFVTDYGMNGSSCLNEFNIAGVCNNGNCVVSTPTPTLATYTITASAGTGGSISPSGTTTVSSGGSQAYAITASSGYSISSVSVDGVSQGAISSYSFTNISANHAISASFSAVLITHTITASAGVGGSIMPSGAVSVSNNGSQSFTITANSGYSINDVLIDGISSGALSSYTFSNATTSHTISALFSVIPATYTITASAGNGGTISPSGATTVSSGGSQTYSITASSGYSISSVSVDGVSQGAVSSYSFTNISANHAISASFASGTAKTCTITANAGDNGRISPSGNITVNEGSSQTFTITPNSGWAIDDILVGGSSVGKVGTFTFNNIVCSTSSALSISANFTCTPATCSGKTCGSWSDNCGGTISCGTCPSGQTCNSSGTCSISTCAPTATCLGRTCGLLSNGCGTMLNCGTCPPGQTCNSSGACTAVSTCKPNCTGKGCGPDGCGGSCGTCSLGRTCDASGLCVVSALSVACEAKPNPSKLGEKVVYTATVSGGNPPLTGYSYKWKGECISSVLNATQCFYTPNKTGKNEVTVEVSDGNKKATATCSTDAVESPLSVSCEAKPNIAMIGEIINISASVTGGSGSLPYSFSWLNCTQEGDDDDHCYYEPLLSDFKNDAAFNKEFKVTVEDKLGNKSATATCYAMLQKTHLKASCTFLPKDPKINEVITFFGSATGGNGDYAYTWNDACMQNIAQPSHCEISCNGPCTIRAKVTIISGDEIDVAECPAVEIKKADTDNDYNPKKPTGVIGILNGLVIWIWNTIKTPFVWVYNSVAGLFTGGNPEISPSPIATPTPTPDASVDSFPEDLVITIQTNFDLITDNLALSCPLGEQYYFCSYENCAYKSDAYKSENDSNITLLEQCDDYGNFVSISDGEETEENNSKPETIVPKPDNYSGILFANQGEIPKTYIDPAAPFSCGLKINFGNVRNELYQCLQARKKLLEEKNKLAKQLIAAINDRKLTPAKRQSKIDSLKKQIKEVDKKLEYLKNADAYYKQIKDYENKNALIKDIEAEIKKGDKGMMSYSGKIILRYKDEKGKEQTKEIASGNLAYVENEENKEKGDFMFEWKDKLSAADYGEYAKNGTLECVVVNNKNQQKQKTSGPKKMMESGPKPEDPSDTRPDNFCLPPSQSDKKYNAYKEALNILSKYVDLNSAVSYSYSKSKDTCSLKLSRYFLAVYFFKNEIKYGGEVFKGEKLKELIAGFEADLKSSDESKAEEAKKIIAALDAKIAEAINKSEMKIPVILTADKPDGTKTTLNSGELSPNVSDTLNGFVLNASWDSKNGDNKTCKVCLPIKAKGEQRNILLPNPLAREIMTKLSSNEELFDDQYACFCSCPAASPTSTTSGSSSASTSTSGPNSSTTSSSTSSSTPTPSPTPELKPSISINFRIPEEGNKKDKGYVGETEEARKFTPVLPITPYDDISVLLKVPKSNSGLVSAGEIVIYEGKTRSVINSGAFKERKDLETNDYKNYEWVVRGWNGGNISTGIANSEENLLKLIDLRNIVAEVKVGNDMIKTDSQKINLCVHLWGDAEGKGEKNIKKYKISSVYDNSYVIPDIIGVYKNTLKNAIEGADPFRKYRQNFEYYADIKTYKKEGDIDLGGFENLKAVDEMKQAIVESSCNNKDINIFYVFSSNKELFSESGAFYTRTTKGVGGILLNKESLKQERHIVHELGHHFNLQDEYVYMRSFFGVNSDVDNFVKSDHNCFTEDFYKKQLAVNNFNKYLGCVTPRRYRSSLESIMNSSGESFNNLSCAVILMDISNNKMTLKDAVAKCNEFEKIQPKDKCSSNNSCFEAKFLYSLSPENCIIDNNFCYISIMPQSKMGCGKDSKCLENSSKSNDCAIYISSNKLSGSDKILKKLFGNMEKGDDNFNICNYTNWQCNSLGGCADGETCVDNKCKKNKKIQDDSDL